MASQMGQGVLFGIIGGLIWGAVNLKIVEAMQRRFSSPVWALYSLFVLGEALFCFVPVRHGLTASELFFKGDPADKPALTHTVGTPQNPPVAHKHKHR